MSRTVRSLFTYDLVIFVLFFELVFRILNVCFVLKCPCMVDRMFLYLN